MASAKIKDLSMRTVLHTAIVRNISNEYALCYCAPSRHDVVADWPIYLKISQ
jgi:hypothetical protein